MPASAATCSGTKPSIQRLARLSASAEGASARSSTQSSKKEGSGTSKMAQLLQGSDEVQDTTLPLTFMFDAQRIQKLDGGPSCLLPLDPINLDLRALKKPLLAGGGGAGAATGTSTGCSSVGVSRCTMMACSSSRLIVSSSPTAWAASSEPGSEIKTAAGLSAPAVACSMAMRKSSPVTSPGTTSSYTSSSALSPAPKAKAVMLTRLAALVKCTTCPSTRWSSASSASGAPPSSKEASSPPQVGTTPSTARWPFRSAQLILLGTDKVRILVLAP
mmetsp:Transcript_50839/g.91377  ORF Transcript_50839/g.91377 Transcript_50839/m.91377 type:complete len:274 (+) Transcript_50839:453-1274(+)